MNRTKKLVRLIVSLCMIFTLTSAIAFAEETTTPIQLGYRGAAMEIEVAGDSETSYFEYGVGGMELVVTGDNAYVVFAGEKYEAEDGEVSVLLTGGNPRMPVEFVVGNSGAEAATFTVDFAYPVGSMSNPFVLEEAGYVSAEVAEGNQEGYWITYTAPQAGTLTVEIYGASDADYNELGWTYVVNQMTACKYGDYHTSADEELVMSETFEVNENDVIQVMMNTFDAENPWSAPAGTVSAYFTFTPPAGTIDNPIMIEDSDYDTPEVTADITVEAGTSKYYMGYLDGMNMVVSCENLSIIYNGETYTANDGVIAISFPPSAGMGRPMPCIFQIVNDGTTDLMAGIVCTYPAGHQMNPEQIEAGKYVVDITEGSNGHFYTWTAPSDGKVTISVSSDKGWTYCVNNMTAGKYGDNHFYDDDPLVSSETLTVTKGDVIQIIVCTSDADLYYASVDGEVNVEVVFSLEDGMHKADDGVWYYYKDGKVDTTYTGMAKNEYGWWYMTNGKLDTKYTGMAKNEYGWWYMTNGKLDTKYTGMAKNQYGWWYMTNGKLDTKYTGMAKNEYGWWYMTNGKLDTKYTGMAKNQYGWWYMTNGKLDTKYTGMAKNQYGWWYMTNGKLDAKYTGLAENDYGTWYMQNGKIDTKFSGTVTVAGKTYEVKNGKVQ